MSHTPHTPTNQLYVICAGINLSMPAFQMKKTHLFTGGRGPVRPENGQHLACRPPARSQKVRNS